MLAVKHNIPAVRKKMDRLRLLVDGGWQEDIVAVMQLARETVARMTPESKGTKRIVKGRNRGKGWHGQHLRKGWTVKTIGRGGKDRVPVLSVVYNQFTHSPTGAVKSFARLRSKKSGETKNYSILEVLEYGSRSHPIEAVDARVLRFVTRKGDVKYRKKVSHPGTKPYAMVRRTRALLRRWLLLLTLKWHGKVIRAWRYDR